LAAVREQRDGAMRPGEARLLLLAAIAANGLAD
jgi:hypothetical protein